MRKKKEYALYKGEECIAIGTSKEIAEQLNILEKSVLFYRTPTYQKRGRGNLNTRRVLIELED